jgi:hypothetical protein
MGPVEETVTIEQPVGAGYALRRAARFASSLKSVAIDREARAALVVCGNGDLVVLDLDALRVERLLDDPPELITRLAEGRSEGDITLAFARDAQRIAVVDDTHAVTLFERLGALVWKRALPTPPPLNEPRPLGDWYWKGAEVLDEGGVLRVNATWAHDKDREPDGYYVTDYVTIAFELAMDTGDILAQEERWLRVQSGPKRIVFVGYERPPTIFVCGAPLELGDRYGAVRAMVVTRDAARIVVTTDARWLLVLERCL